MTLESKSVDYSTLTFNGVELQTINHNNQIWMTSSELAKALGYAREDSVSRIFDRNKDEFSVSMSILRDRQIDGLGESSGLQTMQRFFSLRGCHLIAMLSKTKVAKLFRAWVLDVLDKEVSKKEAAIEKQLFKPRPYTTPLHPTMMTRQMKTHVQHMIDVSVHEKNQTTNKVVLDLARHFYCDTWELIPMKYYPEICAYFEVPAIYKVQSTNHWVMVEESQLGKLNPNVTTENRNAILKICDALEAVDDALDTLAMNA